MIPYGKQSISQDDIDAVVEVLRSDFLTTGPTVPLFEQAVVSHCGAGHAIAVNSATSALHLACLALGVGPADIVWTSPITFVASANCARYCGAEVDFVDIDARTFNMSPAALETKLNRAKRIGRLPKVVIPVHMAGQSCDMAAIGELAHQYGFRVIEDASHAIGGQYRDEPVGCCRYSDIAVFSFHPVKIITTGEGGLATTNDAELAASMELLRSHGIVRDAAHLRDESHGPWYYEQQDLGLNYRMTDIQAVLGLSQVQRLDQFVQRRHEIARRYDKQLEGLPLTTPWQDSNCYSSLHLYVVRLRTNEIDAEHREVFEGLRDAGIGVQLHYIPVYLHPYYRDLGFEPGMCPQAEAYYGEAISLPMFPDLDTAQQDIVVQALKVALDE